MITQYCDEIRELTITVGRGLSVYIAVHDRTILHAEHHRPADKAMPDRFARHCADTAALTLTRRRPSDVAAKPQAAEEPCVHAFTHAGMHGYKSWRYALVPHDVVAENMSLPGLLARYE
jgi:hypothetical protein